MDMNKQIASSRQLLDQLLQHYQVIPELEHYSQKDLARYDALVEEALNSLSPQRRKIYELCKKEKKSYEEVAQELGISQHTVKAHITQALSLLRSYVSRHLSLAILALLMRKFL